MARQETDQNKKFGKDHGLVHEAMVSAEKLNLGRDFFKALAHDKKFGKLVRNLASRHGCSD